MEEEWYAEAGIPLADVLPPPPPKKNNNKQTNNNNNNKTTKRKKYDGYNVVIPDVYMVHCRYLTESYGASAGVIEQRIVEGTVTYPPDVSIHLGGVGLDGCLRCYRLHSLPAPPGVPPVLQLNPHHQNGWVLQVLQATQLNPG